MVIRINEHLSVVTLDPFNTDSCCQRDSIVHCDLAWAQYFQQSDVCCHIFASLSLEFAYSPIIMMCSHCGKPWQNGTRGVLKGKIFRLFIPYV